MKYFKLWIKTIFKCFDQYILSTIKYFISRKNKNNCLDANKKRKLLIDCSYIYKTNINTGIQRVVNNIIKYSDKYSKEKGFEIITVTFEDGFITEVDLNQKKLRNDSNFIWMRRIKKIQEKLHLYKL